MWVRYGASTPLADISVVAMIPTAPFLSAQITFAWSPFSNPCPLCSGVVTMLYQVQVLETKTMAYWGRDV